MIVAVANPRLWSRFCAAIGAENLEHDPRFATNDARLSNRAMLNEAIGTLFADETVDSLIGRLSAAGVPCGRVRSIEEVLDDLQLAARGMLVDIPTSEGVVKMPGNPIKLSGISPLATLHRLRSASILTRSAIAPRSRRRAATTPWRFRTVPPLFTLAPYIVKAMALIGVQRRGGSNMFRHQLSTLAILLDYKLVDPVLLKAAVIHDLFEDAATLPGVSEEAIARSTRTVRPL